MDLQLQPVTRMWEAQTIGQVVTSVVVPVLAAIGFGGRRRRLRNEIKENLNLVEEVEKHDLLNRNTLTAAWLQGENCG